MAEIIFLYQDARIVPGELLRATHNFEAFRKAHLEYWRRYGGQEGLCNYREAYEYLVSDMREHDLPVRYSNYISFKVQQSKHA